MLPSLTAGKLSEISCCLDWCLCVRFTLSQLPRSISDAIYGRVQGAVFDSTNQWWTVPCGQYLNVSFNFGGRNYPIHPLDLVDNNLALTDKTGQRVCLGAVCFTNSRYLLFLPHFPTVPTNYICLQYIWNIWYDSWHELLWVVYYSIDFNLPGSSIDSILVRNTYTLLNGGNSIDDSVDQVNPYVQLASIIDPIAAKQDFINIRLGGNSSALSDPKYALLPANESQHSPLLPGEKTKELEEEILSRLPYILLGVAILVALITGFCIWRCCCRGKKNRKCCCCCGRKGKNLPRNDPRVFAPGTGNVSYVPLESRSMKDDASTYSLPAYQDEYGKGGKGVSGQYWAFCYQSLEDLSTTYWSGQIICFFLLSFSLSLACSSLII